MRKALRFRAVIIALWPVVLLFVVSCGEETIPTPTVTANVETPVPTPTAVTADAVTTSDTSDASGEAAPTYSTFQAGAFFDLIPVDLAEGYIFDWTSLGKLRADDNAADIVAAIADSWPLEWKIGGLTAWTGVMQSVDGTREVIIASVYPWTVDQIREPSETSKVSAISLKARGLEPETYRGVEYYQHGGLLLLPTPRWIAFLESNKFSPLVLFSESKETMERIIRHIDRGKKNSLWDEYGAVVAMLRSGASSVSIEDCSVLIDGCERWITAWQVENSSDMTFEMRAVYGADRDAERATTDTADLLELLPYVEDVEANAEDNHVVATGFMGIQESLEDGFFDIPGPTWRD